MTVATVSSLAQVAVQLARLPGECVGVNTTSKGASNPERKRFSGTGLAV